MLQEPSTLQHSVVPGVCALRRLTRSTLYCGMFHRMCRPYVRICSLT